MHIRKNEKDDVAEFVFLNGDRRGFSGGVRRRRRSTFDGGRRQFRADLGRFMFANITASSEFLSRGRRDFFFSRRDLDRHDRRQSATVVGERSDAGVVFHSRDSVGVCWVLEIGGDEVSRFLNRHHRGSCRGDRRRRSSSKSGGILGRFAAEF